ncbi:MAG: GlxA family transcriptional regulator [Alphaproteobacteria bacterium]|jgi:transcriptional regulator GlxA family with amidase domain|nr:GlxA family transcriptional regulator [Rhodospirillales bacterium]MDP6646494.1 GlxA family transcriptional regulator [Rhodospirillales bacterium]MDP6819794.1 GlxA family transcriptional regulator [Alphaproteobacteria bacterium]
MTEQAHSPYEPLKLAFVLLPKYSMIAFSSLIEPIRLANRESGETLFEWSCYSLDGAAVAASNHVVTEVDGAVRDMGDAQLTLVCSGLDVEHITPGPELGKRLRYLVAHGRMIGAACTGAHILAGYGLLDGFRCTIHWENIAALREEFPAIEVTSDIYEIDRKRWTCAGGTAALDMMLRFIAEQGGLGLARRVAEVSLHQEIRAGEIAQRHDLRFRLGTANANVIAAVKVMESHLEDPLSSRQLAATVGLSTRQLERLFRRHFDQTPRQYYLRIRLDKGRDLLRRTSHPILDIAVASGFTSTSHFTKCYRKCFGHTPTEERASQAELFLPGSQ